MAKSRKWPKLACSLGEQILRLANPSLYRSPSEACGYQKILGFILSPFGHKKSIINSQASFRKRENKKRTKTDGNPDIETLETNLEDSE
jgi:hypothetical protein